jgi:GT2 family glycosyltransferase
MTILFDQAQRYLVAADLINALRVDKEKLSILEVGANVHANLDTVLPDDSCTFLDQELDDSVSADPRFVTGDATDMDFEDDSFDIVLSLDVFEHIPPSLRQRFLAEKFRVAKSVVILAAPFNFPEVEAAEYECRLFFEKFMGHKHEWLEEHKEEGLPDFGKTVEITESMGKVYSFSHGNLKYWPELLKSHFCEVKNSDLGVDFEELNRLYVKYLCLDDYAEQGYRNFIVLLKDPSKNEQISSFLERKSIPSSGVVEPLVAGLISVVKSQLEQRVTERALTDSKNHEKNLQMLTLNQQLAQKDQQIDYKKIVHQQLLSRNVSLNEAHVSLSEAHESLIESHQSLSDRYGSSLVRIRGLELSVSWKLTRPLRSVSFRMKRLLAFLRSVQDKNNPQQACVVEGSTASDTSISGDYQKWISKQFQNSDDRFKKLLSIVELSPNRPKISIILPVYNTDEKYLRAAIDSVLKQKYTSWELCVSDDASNSEEVRRIVSKYSEQDSRIKHIFREENGHISAASNSALSIASGDYIGLLDHDDELAPEALLVMAVEIIKQPSVKILYSDEDKITCDGERFDPHFKSDWNPVLLEAQNYISHLAIIRREIIDSVGGFRIGYEGAQDYDLFLRCTSVVDDSAIQHVPNILYHWRAIKGSTAMSADEKSYAHDAGIKALTDYVESSGITADVVNGINDTTYRICRKLKSDEPSVSIIIPTRDMLQTLKMCVNSILLKTEYQNYEIVIADNQSEEVETLRYFDSISRHPQVRVVSYPHPFNYSKINNFAVGKCDSQIVALVNNDIEVISSNWLGELVSYAVVDEYGCVGAKLYYPNDKVQHAGVILGIGGVAGHSHKYFERDEAGYFSRAVLPQNLSAVTAACLVVRKKVYDEVGGLDEKLQIAFNDIDFCLKVRLAGYKNVFTPYAELYHHESLSRGEEDTLEKQQRFSSEVKVMIDRWGPLLECDPYYNKNLTLLKEDFSIDLLSYDFAGKG